MRFDRTRRVIGSGMSLVHFWALHSSRHRCCRCSGRSQDDGCTCPGSPNWGMALVRI